MRDRPDPSLTAEQALLLDAERAGPMRIRAAVVALVSLAIWLSQYLLYESDIFAEPARALPYRIGELGLTLGLAAFLLRPRSARQIEWATVLAFSALSVLHAWAILLCRDEVVVPFTLTLEWSAMVIVLAAGISFRATVAYLTTTFFAGAVATGIRARWDTDFSDHIVLLGIYALLAASVRSYDKLRLREFSARTALGAANEELRRTEEARTRLFTNISHDFRTPLALIHTEAELLAAQSRSAEELEALTRIRGNARTLAELTEQLLELAQLGEGRLRPRAVPFDLLELARDVAAELGGGSGRVRVVAEGSPVGVTADPRHVRRILTNLVGNGLRQLRTPSDEVRIEAAEAGDAVLVRISDDGPGILPELRETIFERFASFDAAGSLASGIGLPLARELATLAGGALVLEDAERTTFRLTLQRAREPLTSIPRPVVPSSEGSARAMDATASSGASILIVEDNVEMGALLARVLGARFAVRSATSVEEARRHLDERDVDLVLCDVMLPDGDGYDVLEHLQRGSATPFLFLTALGDPEQRAKGLTAGADDYIPKPFSTEELHARIDAALRRSAARRLLLERQRQELLAELHAGVTASLSRAALLLKASTEQADPARIARAKEAVLEGLTEARTLLALSSEEAVPWQTLMDTVRDSLDAAQASFGLRTELVVDTDKSIPALPGRAAHTLRRFVREGLTNVIKHADASSVRLEIRASGGELRVSLTDDGRGPGSAREGGMGLSVAARRVRELDGELEVGPAPERGTRVSARFRPRPATEPPASGPSDAVARAS